LPFNRNLRRYAAGLDVRVYEQREEFRPAGVAIFIWQGLPINPKP
jgi:hypothetical protein